jgi:16S rRNA (cytidine1402-2'-O)-methyltransferase
MLKEGKSLALISDAGTPGISDPGYLLVKSCVDNGIEVESLPGATAFVPALVNSGFPTDRFVYEGFLPHKKGRQTRWKALAEEERTIVLYESPHRLVKALEQIIEFIAPERPVMVGRELSKMHEQMVRGTATEVLAYFVAHPDKVRGEIVIVIAGK